MVVPTDELAVLIRDWYYAASEGQTKEFFDYFLQDERTVYFGSDPGEIWYGYEAVRAGLMQNFGIYGKWTIMSKNLVVRQLDDSAFFTDDVELSVRQGGNSFAEDARISGVLIRTAGGWKIIQVHMSFGVPNTKLLSG